MVCVVESCQQEVVPVKIMCEEMRSVPVEPSRMASFYACMPIIKTSPLYLLLVPG